MDPLSEMLDSILDKRPKLKELNSDQTILEYLRPAVEWKQQKDIFPILLFNQPLDMCPAFFS